MSQFIKTKYDCMETGKQLVAFSYDPEDGKTAFKLVARGDGLVIQGSLDGEFIIQTEEQLQNFAKVVSEAWQERRRLRPKLETNAAGH